VNIKPHREPHKFDIVRTVRDTHRPKSGAYAVASEACVWRERLTYTSFAFARARLARVKLQGRAGWVVAFWRRGVWHCVTAQQE
jgi:hypothetical protein